MAKKKDEELEHPPAPPEETETQVDRQEEKRRRTDYEKLLDKVKVVHELTNTDGWAALYTAIRAEIEAHGKAVLDAEKPRDVVHHQMGVKVLRHVIELARRPVDDLNNFISSVPMFAQGYKTRAEWNEGLGKVVLKDLK